MLQKIQESYKAIVGAIVAVATLVIAANADDNIDFSEWSGIGSAVVAGAVAFGAIWWVRNKAPATPPPPETPDG